MENVNSLFHISFWVVIFISAITLAITQLDKASTLNSLTSEQTVLKTATTMNGSDSQICKVDQETIIADICSATSYDYPYIIDGVTLKTEDYDAIMTGNYNVLGYYIHHRYYNKTIYLNTAGTISRIEYRHL